MMWFRVPRKMKKVQKRFFPIFHYKYETYKIKIKYFTAKTSAIQKDKFKPNIQKY